MANAAAANPPMAPLSPPPPPLPPAAAAANDRIACDIFNIDFQRPRAVAAASRVRGAFRELLPQMGFGGDAELAGDVATFSATATASSVRRR